MSAAQTRRQVAQAIAACESKKAFDFSLLKLDAASSGFTDYFIVCSGTNPRQIQAISDEVEEKLERAGLRAAHIEGYRQAEWVLLDYVDFVVHIFSARARRFYDLERLWKSAKRLDPASLQTEPRRPAAAPRRKPARRR
ncbi:MAG: ribosome silencing factor [Terriglobales bacterium]